MASRDGTGGHFGAHSGVAAAGAAAAIAAAASSQALPTPSPPTGAHPLLTDVVLPTAAFVPATVTRGQLIVKTTRDSAPDVQWLAPFIQSALLEGKTRVLVRSESSKSSSWVVDLVTWCVWQADGDDDDDEGDHVDVLNPRTAVHALSVMAVHNQMDNVTPGAAGATDGRKVEEVPTATTTTSGVSLAPPRRLSPLLQRFDGTAQLWIWCRHGISFRWWRVERNVQRIMVLCMWQALHGLFASTPSHRYRSKSSQQDAIKYKWLLCPRPFCVVDTKRQLVCPARLTRTTPHKAPSAAAQAGAGAGTGAGATAAAAAAAAAQTSAPSLLLPPTVLLETPQNVMAYMPPPWAGHMQKTWPLLSSEAWCNKTAAMVHDRFLPQCVRFDPTRGFVKHHPSLNARGTGAFRPLSTAAAEWPTQLYHHSVADEAVRLAALQRSVRQTPLFPTKSQRESVLIPNASLQRLPHLVRTPDVARTMARTVEPCVPGDHEVLSRIVQYLVTSLDTARPLHVMELHVPESAAAVRATCAVRAAQLAATRGHVRTLQQLLNSQERVLPLVVDNILVWLDTFVDLGSEMRDSGNTVMLWHCTSPHEPLEMVLTRRGPSIAQSSQGHRAVWDNGIHAFTAAYVSNMFGSYAVPPERCGGRPNVKQMLLVTAVLGCPANAEWPAGTRGRGAYARATLRAYVRNHCTQTHSAADVARMEEAVDGLVFHTTLSTTSRTGSDVSTFGVGHHAMIHRDNAVTPSFLVTYEEQPHAARAKPQRGAHTRKRKAKVLVP